MDRPNCVDVFQPKYSGDKSMPTNEEIYYVLSFIKQECDRNKRCDDCMFKSPNLGTGCGITYSAPSEWQIRNPNKWLVFNRTIEADYNG